MMGLGRIFGRMGALSLSVAVAASLSCGQSNDQGISFRALGFFQTGVDAPDGGDFVALDGSDACVPSDDDGDGVLDDGFLALQNNMVQGIRVERVDLTYRLHGATIGIPNHSATFAFRLGSATGSEPNSPSTNAAQVLCIVPAELFEFLRQNRSRIPTPPFTLIATARAVGVADSGEVFITNAVSYHATFFETRRSGNQTQCPPGTFDDGSGTCVEEP